MTSRSAACRYCESCRCRDACRPSEVCENTAQQAAADHLSPADNDGNDANHRHRIDKYLDTLLANQTARKVKPPTIAKKGSAQDGGLPELLLA